MSFKLTSKPIIAATAGAVVLGVSGYIWQEEKRNPVLDVYVFDLSSGRSIFIRTPDDYRILVDGGSNSDIIREVTAHIPFYSRRIDALVATNNDAKNVGGFIDILDRYHVDDVYIPGITLESLSLASSTDGVSAAFHARLKSAHVKLHDTMAGNTLLFGNNVTAKIHFPVTPEQFLYSRSSAPEVLFTVSYKQTAFTFLGNASHKVQEFLAATSTHMQSADALIVSHSALPAHMSAKLTEKLDPTYLVYSKEPTSTKPAAKPTSTTTTTGKPKKIPIDPLLSVASDRRFNLKEKGTIHLVSDGQKLFIK